MTITIYSQINTFLISIIVGIGLGLVFDGVKIANTILNDNSKRIFFTDVFYFSFSAIVTFVYMLIMCMGEIRFYVIIGELLGWILYRITIENFIYKIILSIFIKMKKLISFIKKYLVSKIPKIKFKKLKLAKINLFAKKQK